MDTALWSFPCTLNPSEFIFPPSSEFQEEKFKPLSLLYFSSELIIHLKLDNCEFLITNLTLTCNWAALPGYKFKRGDTFFIAL